MQSAKGAVNQQLAWCRLLLSSFETAQLPWQQQCLVQSLGLHLQLAYRAFLAELASNLRCTVDAAPTIASLIRSIPAGREVPLELKEVQRLEMEASWLSALLAYSPSTITTTLAASAVTAKAPSDMIASSGAVPFDLALARSALSGLEELIARNRQLSDEC